ncbi:polyketide synthase [Colletotrichum tofieldiae]|nr:polyketide synthase [Colletotrichum tofieldiae]GKT74489.1 polyketide synthase [Colletotrichum tofieldiae]
MVVLGGVPGDSFGCDVAGVNSRSNPGSKFRQGDRVACCSNYGKGFGTYACYPEQDLTVVPNDMPLHVAASISTVWCTLVYSFDYSTPASKADRLDSRRSRWCRPGCAPVGNIARATVFAKVSSDANRELVQDLYDIPGDQIFHSHDSSFQDNVMNVTNRRSADMALNCLSGELLRHFLLLDCSGPNVSPETRSFINEAEALGANILALLRDCSDRNALEKVLKDAAA